jgi:hypothetical protein
LKRGVWHGPFLLLAACSPNNESETRCVSAPLAGGAARGELLALAPSQEGAIVRLNLLDAEGTLGICTGTLVAPGQILTAAHCLVPEAVAFEVAFPGPASLTEVVPTSDATLHPELDLALLNLAEPPSIEAVPIGVGFSSPSPGDVVQLAGFDDFGGLSFAATVVTDVDAESFTVSADGRAAACFGDSGGPTLTRNARGAVMVLGALSSGKTSCAGLDRFVRLDAAVSWLESQGVGTETSDPLADCSLLPSSGRCFAETAFWCDADGRLSVEQCDPESICGFSRDASGFRCVPPDRDPCQGIDDRGHCDGDTLTRCENGRVTRQACAQCGATCRVSVVKGDAVCNAD